jgi:hypothetical protein
MNIVYNTCSGCGRNTQQSDMISCCHPHDDYGRVFVGLHSYCEICYKNMVMRIINDEETFHRSGQGLKCLPMEGQCVNVLRLIGMVFIFIYLYF